MLTLAQLRRFHLRSLRLGSPFASVAQALEHLGYVQLDPINVCGRMHDLILRNRLESHAPGALLDTLHGEPRIGFEHYFGVHVAHPLAAWPFLVRAMRARAASSTSWGGKLGPGEERIARYALDQLRERGPLPAEAIEHDARGRTAWGQQGRLLKIVMDRLFLHGRVLVARRPGYRRVYDLPERVLPPEILHAPLPSPEENARWQVLTRLKQRRLATLNRRELPLVRDWVTPLDFSDGGPPLFCLNEDLPVLEEVCESDAPVVDRPLLLAPLDPLLYDRKLTARVWAFDYTWEVYTPPAKRKRGYYALPLLSQDRIVGHIDPKADREAGRLRVLNRQVARGHRWAPAVRELAGFLGLK